MVDSEIGTIAILSRLIEDRLFDNSSSKLVRVPVQHQPFKLLHSLVALLVNKCKAVLKVKSGTNLDLLGTQDSLLNQHGSCLLNDQQPLWQNYTRDIVKGRVVINNGIKKERGVTEHLKGKRLLITTGGEL